MIEQFYLPIDGTLIGTTNPSHSRPGSNGHEGVPYIRKNFRIRALASDEV